MENKNQNQNEINQKEINNVFENEKKEYNLNIQEENGENLNANFSENKDDPTSKKNNENFKPFKIFEKKENLTEYIKKCVQNKNEEISNLNSQIVDLQKELLILTKNNNKLILQKATIFEEPKKHDEILKAGKA